jgi:hypothetical protein
LLKQLRERIDKWNYMKFKNFCMRPVWEGDQEIAKRSGRDEQM